MEWQACTMEPNGWLRWMECHPGTSSYVQAAGAIAALGLALATPLVQGWLNRRQEQARVVRRATTMLSSLYGEMVTLQAEVERSRKMIEEKPVEHDDSLNRLHWFAALQLRIPQELAEAVKVLADVPVRMLNLW